MPSLLRTEAEMRSVLITVTQMCVSLDLTNALKCSFGSRAVIDFDAAMLGAATFIDFKGRELLSAELNGRPIDVATWADGRLPLTGLAQHNHLVVEGVMEFSSDGEGLHRHVDADGLTYVYAMSFLDAAPRWFACFDQPDLKAPYRFDVLAPDGWTVWGNGPSCQDDDGRWIIEQSCALATYFVTIVAGPWAVAQREHDGIPLTLLARQSLADELICEADNILDVTGVSFDAYHAMFTPRYPYGSYVQAFVPDFNAGAMENPGCITLRDQYLLRGRPTRRERAQRAGTIAHEMAHQWFGDLVTMRWWDDLWLNESFAEYMGHRVIAEHTSYELWTQFGILRKDWGAQADLGPGTHPVAVNGADDAQGALANFDGISYAKGASLLRQAATAMGDDVFLRGLDAYFAAHRYGNATFADLMAAWRDAGATGIQSFADQWLCTSGMDKISVLPDGTQLVIERGRSGGAASVGVTFDVAALDEDGAELARQTVRDALPGQRSLDAPPPGTVVVVPDAGDLTWAKLRSSTWALPPIGHVWDAATRVVLHNCIRDAVRDGELPVPDALDLLRRGLPGEISDDIVAAMAGFAVDLAGPWSPWELRAQRMGDVAELLTLLAGECQPGSDRQMILAKALAHCGDQSQLSGWLKAAPGGVWQGLEPDPELRWVVVTRLVALGGDTTMIDDELQRDPLGADKAAGARAAAPTLEAKRAALDALLLPSQLPAYDLYAIAEHVWQVGQEPLCAEPAIEWFAGIGATAGFRVGWSLARVARLSFPMVVASSDMLALAQDTTANVGDERLRRELADATATLSRVIRQCTAPARL